MNDKAVHRRAPATPGLLIKYRRIECKYFYKGNGCRRGDSCWFSHSDRKKHMKEFVIIGWTDGADTLRMTWEIV